MPPISEFEADFDPTTSDVSNEKGSFLLANVSTGQNGSSYMPVQIHVRNVICNYSLPIHVDLRSVAMNSKDVTYDRNRGVLYKQKRDPHCYVKLYSSGSVYIVGCRSEDECKRAARGVGRMVQRSMQKLDATIRMRNFRISNMLSTCKLPFGVKIEDMAKKYPNAIYEPELTVGLTWKFDSPKSTLRIHTTGSITITGSTSSSDTVLAIQKIFPIVEEFKCPLRSTENKSSATALSRRRRAPLPNPFTSGPVSKQPRKTAPVYDPACSEFFEENMNFQEENFYEDNLC